MERFWSKNYKIFWSEPIGINLFLYRTFKIFDINQSELSSVFIMDFSIFLWQPIGIKFYLSRLFESVQINQSESSFSYKLTFNYFHVNQ